MANINNYDDLLKAYSQVINLNTPELRIIESLRFKDGDQSGKLAGVLAFSGLIIATSIVQLASSPESVLYLHKDSSLIYANLIGLFFLFLSSFLSLRGLTITSDYSKKSTVALQQFHKIVVTKSNLSKWSIILSAMGAFFALASFFISVANKIS